MKNLAFVSLLTMVRLPLAAQAPAAPVIVMPGVITKGYSGYLATTIIQSGCTYQWAVSGGTITNTRNSTYTSGIDFKAGTNNQLTVTCVAKNTAGLYSTPGSQTVNLESSVPPPIITGLPSYVRPGKTGYFAYANFPIPSNSWCNNVFSITNGTITGGGGSGSGSGVNFTAGSSGRSVTVNCITKDYAGAQSPTSSVVIPIIYPPQMPILQGPVAVRTNQTFTVTVLNLDPYQVTFYSWNNGSTSSQATFTAPNYSTNMMISCYAMNVLGESSPAGVAIVSVVPNP